MKEYKKACVEVIDFSGSDVISGSSTYAEVATTTAAVTPLGEIPPSNSTTGQ